MPRIPKRYHFYVGDELLLTKLLANDSAAERFGLSIAKEYPGESVGVVGADTGMDANLCYLKSDPDPLPHHTPESAVMAQAMNDGHRRRECIDQRHRHG